MKFQFVKVKNPRCPTLDYGWMMKVLPSSFYDWWEWKHKDSATKAWVDYSENVTIRDGHAWGHPTTGVGAMALATAEIKGTSFVDEMGSLFGKTFLAMDRTTRKGHTLYVNSKGGWNYGFDEISETVERDEPEFPRDAQYTKNDIDVRKYQGGRHYYGKVGNVEIEGVKRNTVEAAQSACDELVDQLNSTLLESGQ